MKRFIHNTKRLQNIYREVKLAQKRYLSDYKKERFREKVYWDRDRKIYELHKEGKSYKEIADEMGQRGLDEFYLPQIVSRYKKTIGE